MRWGPRSFCPLRVYDISSPTRERSVILAEVVRSTKLLSTKNQIISGNAKKLQNGSLLSTKKGVEDVRIDINTKYNH